MVRGVANNRPSVLFVSNHSSYLDIIVLGSVLEACFISKSEVASWPLFGLLAKLNHTVFVKRRVVESSKKLVEIKDRLALGQRLILLKSQRSTKTRPRFISNPVVKTASSEARCGGRK